MGRSIRFISNRPGRLFSFFRPFLAGGVSSRSRTRGVFISGPVRAFLERGDLLAPMKRNKVTEPPPFSFRNVRDYGEGESRIVSYCEFANIYFDLDIFGHWTFTFRLYFSQKGTVDHGCVRWSKVKRNLLAGRANNRVFFAFLSPASILLFIPPPPPSLCLDVIIATTGRW